MLRLFILRHAKSSWGTAGVADVQRPLNERGIRDLPRIAAVMAKRNYQPEIVYCSSANRTRMTLNGLFSGHAGPPPVIYSDLLYSGGMQDYLRIIAAHKSPESIMIIGHNPCVHMLAAHLAEQGKTSKMDELAIKYPTGTLSVIDFDFKEWSQIQDNKGTLIDFICPRSLRD